MDTPGKKQGNQKEVVHRLIETKIGQGLGLLSPETGIGSFPIFHLGGDFDTGRMGASTVFLFLRGFIWKTDQGKKAATGPGNKLPII